MGTVAYGLRMAKRQFLLRPRNTDPASEKDPGVLDFTALGTSEYTFGARTQTHTHTHTHAYTRTVYTHTRVHTCTHTRTHTCTHPRTHMHTHTRTHVHTHT